MPLQKLIFKPGVNREGTTLTNEGSWFETDKVRFRSGFPEKIGGWAAQSSTFFLGVCRSLWNWVTLKNFNLLGVGTNQKFYVENGGNYYDITPITNTVAITNIAVDGYVATFTLALSSPFQTGDIVAISGVAAPIGSVPADVLNQQYFIKYIDGTTFSVKLREVSALEAPGAYFYASSAASAAAVGSVDFLLPTGLPTYTVGTGWGVGPWSNYNTVALTDPFSATAGGTSLTINYVNHGLGVEDYIVLASIADATVAGISRAALLKTYQVATVIDADNFTISTASGSGLNYIALTTAAATSEGGAVTLRRFDPLATAYGWGDGYTVGGTVTGLQLRLWSQSTFGENLIINPRGGALYIWQPGSGPLPAFNSRATLIDSAQAPTQVNEVLVSDATRIVIAFGCTDYTAPFGTGEFDPMLIRWTTNEDYEAWEPTATNQAGSYRLSHGSEIITSMLTRQEILVWTDAAVYSMQYLGPPYVWGFNILGDNISLISPNAVATANGVVFWMGTDKFYMYSGRVETLPSSLRQFVFQDFNKDQGYQVFAGTNEGYSEVWWYYCSANSNVIDRYVVFNYLDQVWYYGYLHRTAWLDSAIRQYPQATSSVENTVVTLQQVQPTDTSINVQNVSSFPDSGYIKIGDEIIEYGARQNNTTLLTNCVRGRFGTTATTHDVDSIVALYGGNTLLFHEYGNDDASDLEKTRPIEAFIQSSDIDLDDGDRYMFVWQMVPDFSFDGSSSPSADRPQVSLTLKPRQNPGAPYGYGYNPTVRSDQNYGGSQQTYIVQEFTQVVNTRIRGRQVALRITSNTLGTKWQLGALRINMRADGRR